MQVIAERRWTVDLQTACPSSSSSIPSSPAADTSSTDNPLIVSLNHFGVNSIIDDGDTIGMICFAARTRDNRLALHARTIQLIAPATAVTAASGADDTTITMKRAAIKYVNTITH